MKINRLLANVIVKTITTRIRESGGHADMLAREAVLTARRVKEELDVNPELLTDDDGPHAPSAAFYRDSNRILQSAFAERTLERDTLRATVEKLTLQLSRVTDAQKAENAKVTRVLALVLAQLGGGCTISEEAVAQVDGCFWQVGPVVIGRDNASPLVRYELTFRPEVQTPAVPAILPADDEEPS